MWCPSPFFSGENWRYHYEKRHNGYKMGSRSDDWSDIYLDLRKICTRMTFWKFINFCVGRCMCECKCTWACVGTYAHTCACVGAYAHAHVWVHMQMRMYECICTYACVSAYAHAHVWVHIHMHMWGPEENLSCNFIYLSSETGSHWLRRIPGYQTLKTLWGFKVDHGSWLFQMDSVNKTQVLVYQALYPLNYLSHP